MMKTCIRRFAFVVVLLSASAVSVGAQQPILSEGQRVRITTSTVKRAEGLVARSTPDSLVIFSASGGGRTAVATRALEKLEVSAGKNAVAGAKKGAIWGGVIGGVAGLIFLVAPCDVPNGSSADCGASARAQYAAISLGSGVLYGLGIGAIVKAEKWESVNIQPQVTLSRDRIGLAMNIAGLH